MKKFIIFLTLALPLTLQSKVVKDDLGIFYDYNAYGNRFVFQPVQSVWVVDTVYGSEMKFIDDYPLTYDCSELVMIANKPTLIFGGHDSTERISFTVLNTYDEAREAWLNFRIVEDGNHFWQSKPYIIPTGVSTISIEAPLPEKPFYFEKPGEKHIMMSISYDTFDGSRDADPDNDYFLLKCLVKKSSSMNVSFTPYIFSDINYNGSDFEPYGILHTRCWSEMQTVYSMLPVDELSFVEWNLPKLFDITFDDWYNNFTDTLRKISFNTSLADLFLSQSLSGNNDYPIALTDPDYSLFLNWCGITNCNAYGAFVSWGCGIGSTSAHEISHSYGMWCSPEEYEEYPTGLPAYGYDINEMSYKNFTGASPVYCFMGIVKTQYWIHKYDYKDLIEELTDLGIFTNNLSKKTDVAVISGSVTLNNELTLLPFYEIKSDKITLDTNINTGRYELKFLNSNNQLLSEYWFSEDFKLTEGLYLEKAHFNFTVPADKNINKIRINDSLGNLLAERIITDDSPSIDIIYPDSSQIIAEDSVLIQWNSTDSDNDTLYHSIFYSTDESQPAKWLPVKLNVKGNSFNWKTYFSHNKNYRVKIFVTDGYNTSSDSSDYFIIGTPSQIKVIPQGFYNISNSGLNRRDTANFYLRNITSPYAFVDSAKGCIDSISFAANVFFRSALSGTYYLVAQHRNCIQTWSKAGGETYSTGTQFTYDFTSSEMQAYGSNMILVDNANNRYAMYSGDVNQDGVVDGSDGLLIDNDAANFSTGYLVTDLNGDEVIDGSDAVIADNNAANFITAITP